MEKIQILKRFINSLSAITLVFILAGCTTKKIMDDEGKFDDIDAEFKKVVRVTEAPAKDDKKSVVAAPVQPKPAPTPSAPVPPAVKSATPTPPAKPASAKPVEPVKVPEAEKKRLPEIEDSEGFVGRRPIVDPYRVGEKVVLSVNYFNVTAGDLTIEVKPFQNVNGRKAYDFSMSVKSNSTFSMFYAVNNSVQTLVDYENLVPFTYTVDAKESSRMKEGKTFFDWDKNEASMWVKEIKKGGKEKKRKLVWAIEPYSQSIISAAYYLRAFNLVPGKKVSFYMTDDGKKYVFKGEVLRKEKLKTDVGVLDTVVVKPTFTLDGAFKATGENLIWFTADQYKLPVRIESKIKIGTLVAKLKSIQHGK